VAATYRFSFHALVLRMLPEADYAVALERLAEALPVEVAAVDGAGRVIVWNRAMAEAHGPREDAVGRPLLEALPALAADTNVDWRQALARVLAEGARVDLPRLPLAGRLVRASLVPLSAGGGGVPGAALVLDDITDRERSEERRMRRERSQAIEKLGAGLAHEVRNPLNALSLNLQLLRERLDDPKADRADLAKKADAMIAEMRRLDDLVAHLLEVSRGSPPAREPSRLDDVAARVVERLRATAEKAGVALAFAPGSRRTLPLDPARIDRALHNVVRNAIEAAGKGGHVWVATRDDPHSTVAMVDDDGVGFGPEGRERLFELFFTTKRGGTGLGLPLARRAVLDHGGELEVLDRPGGGARVLVHLPIDEAGADRPEEPRRGREGRRPRDARDPWRAS